MPTRSARCRGSTDSPQATVGKAKKGRTDKQFHPIDFFISSTYRNSVRNWFPHLIRIVQTFFQEHIRVLPLPARTLTPSNIYATSSRDE